MPINWKHFLSKNDVVDGHGSHAALNFGVKVKEHQDKVHT